MDHEMDHSKKSRGQPAQDPLALVSRLRTRLNTFWLRHTYPFAAFGRGASVHHSCDLQRAMSRDMSLGEDTFVGPDVWLNVAPGSESAAPKIILGSGCKIGRRSTLSARN